MTQSTMTPQEIVSELDRHIVGQHEAKRAVAIALRNRWRRQQVEPKLRHEITPKNILMIGPTGVGKTEIARRLARLADAPFVKVEATRFTEVGYVGKDVDTIVRDLVEVAVKEERERAVKRHRVQAEDALRGLGFRVLRVRHHGDVARLEIGRDEMPRMLDPDIAAAADVALRALGFKHVALDLRGYRLGSLNEGLKLKVV